jgi:hypothetical protein
MFENVSRGFEGRGFKTVLRANLVAVTNPAFHAHPVVHDRHVILHGDGTDVAIGYTSLASNTFFGINLHFSSGYGKRPFHNWRAAEIPPRPLKLWKKLIWFFLASFRRKPESRFFTDLRIDWTPVFTGVTNEFQFFHSFRGIGVISGNAYASSQLFPVESAKPIYL